jgi:hypothetical protein
MWLGCASAVTGTGVPGGAGRAVLLGEARIS